MLGRPYLHHDVVRIRNSPHHDVVRIRYCLHHSLIAKSCCAIELLEQYSVTGISTLNYFRHTHPSPWILSPGCCLNVFWALWHQWEAFHKSSCNSIVHRCFFLWFKWGWLLLHCPNMGGRGALVEKFTPCSKACWYQASGGGPAVRPLQTQNFYGSSAYSPCQLLGNSLSHLCSNSSSRCLTGGPSRCLTGRLQLLGDEAERSIPNICH